MAQVIVIRHVDVNDPHSLLGAAAEPGDIFFVHEGPTFGCVVTTEGETALSKKGDGVFFAFPADAVRLLEVTIHVVSSPS